MTKLRKLTALLLAGALALLLLTACGGGGGSASPEAQAEANVMRAINNSRPTTMALSNDDGMRAVANARLDELDKKIELKGDVLGYQSFTKVEIKNGTLTLVAKYDYKDTTLQKIIDRISGGNPNKDLNFALNGNYTKAGVVARTIQGQTYIAISLQIKT
ncbi:MAG: hypothetical protein EGQ64_04845 [Ruminococcaceae bacterium]|nr:hypothetical protein [Oscillospiraceae bacterium]